MAHMQPVAEYFAAYHVETSDRTEIVPEDVCGEITDVSDPGEYGFLAGYLNCLVGNTDIRSVERKEGWYGRLSADGYLDCTEWEGPYATAEEALDAIKEAYGVDGEGNYIGDNDEPSDPGYEGEY